MSGNVFIMPLMQTRNVELNIQALCTDLWLWKIETEWSGKCLSIMHKAECHSSNTVILPYFSASITILFVQEIAPRVFISHPSIAKRYPGSTVGEKHKEMSVSDQTTSVVWWQSLAWALSCGSRRITPLSPVYQVLMTSRLRRDVIKTW